MIDILLVSLIGVIALLFGIATSYFYFAIVHLRVSLPKLINELMVGKSACVVGRLISSSSNLLRSPYGDVECVGFVASVQQKTVQFDSTLGFIASRWVSIGTSSRTSPFLIKDNSGTICVIPARAQLSLSRTICGELDAKHVFQQVRSGLQALYKRFAKTQSLWINECLLINGDAVFVSGRVQPVTQLDLQSFPAQFHSTIKYVLKGSDVIISTTVPASRIPFFEKCMWFCLLSFLICGALVLALLLLF